MPTTNQPGSLPLGRVVGSQQTLTLPADARSMHLHICGATGTGKSKFLEHLIRQDMLDWRYTGNGLLLLDPHGAVYDNIIAWLARYNIKRPIVPIDLRRDDWIIGYNLLRKRDESEASVVVSNLVDAIAYVWGAQGMDETPRLAKWTSTILGTLYRRNLTLTEALYLTDRSDLARLLTDQLDDPVLDRNWQTADTLKATELETQMESTLNRLQKFLGNPVMRSIFGQGGDSDRSLDFRKALDEGWIILVNLSLERSKVSQQDADLFARLLLADLWTSAQERGKRDNLRAFRVYVDEFQRFITPTIAENLAEARGFGLHLTVAHQSLQILADAGAAGKQLYNAILANARSMVAFSVKHHDDLEVLARQLYMGTFNPNEIKHTLYSTKVMNYCEEMRTAYHRSSTVTESSGSSVTDSVGEAEGVVESLTGEQQSFNTYVTTSTGSTSSMAVGETKGTTQSPMLIPEMGRELSHVQFRSLDEQHHRAMAALFDQQQRQCVAKLQGMRSPVSLFTPIVKPAHVSENRIEDYLSRCFDRWPFALPAEQAKQTLAEREVELTNCWDEFVDEPEMWKRPLD